ncbi:VRR-NUC domain-containing protein [Reinekea sp.]|jgi:hypothetical protein|uniref:VRR-NUC domain-containing protein n=1 Tax=Reinekea sp. TaxID=1970455 RepID=UPI002A8288F4|nr:VRR-NUC domain-containing protein [Reinekea sp.]
MTQVMVPDNYYLDYFMRLIDLVRQRYGDLLSPSDALFLQAIDQTDPVALRLLIRLYLRKGPCFVTAKLHYREVPDCARALTALLKQGLIEADPVVFAWQLIDLLPVAQSRQLFSPDEPRCRKSDLIARWLDDATLQPCSAWGLTEAIIQPTGAASYRRLQLLYFGNERQTLTEFVLEDMGLFKYESYRLDRSNRLFQDADDITTTLTLNDLADDFYRLCDAKDWPALTKLSAQVLALQPSGRLARRHHRLLNRIAYRLEQAGELDLAVTCFSTNNQPPARERLTRIAFKRGQYQDCLSQLTSIAEQPVCSDETAFYQRFINRVLGKLDRPKLAFPAPTLRVTQAHWVRGSGSVEVQACEQLGDAVWLENALPLGVFGLLYWPVIFADVPGVWQHPFQSGPTDLYDEDFCAKRQTWLASLATHSKAQWRTALIERWHTKHGLANPFVHWAALSLAVLLACFDALSQAQWFGLSQHLWADLRRHRAGFPDLFQYHDDGYCFIEIKGPGDKLQDNQIHWLTQFARLGINAEVCYVRYDAQPAL